MLRKILIRTSKAAQTAIMIAAATAWVEGASPIMIQAKPAVDMPIIGRVELARAIGARETPAV